MFFIQSREMFNVYQTMNKSIELHWLIKYRDWESLQIQVKNSSQEVSGFSVFTISVSAITASITV